MYLSELSQKDREKFLELGYKIANSDHEYSDTEIRILTRFKKELEISAIPVTASVSELEDYFAAKDLSVKKIVYFEISGILYSNGLTLNEKNQKTLAQLQEKFALSDEMASAIKQASEALEMAYEKANKAVMQ